MKIIKNIFCFVGLLFFINFAFLAQTDLASANNLWDMQDDDIKKGISEPFGDQAENPTDVREVVVRIIKIFLSLLGIIFLVMIMWSGFRWMTSGGSQDKVEKAKSQLITSIIGFAIIVSAYVITNVVDYAIRVQLFGDPW